MLAFPAEVTPPRRELLFKCISRKQPLESGIRVMVIFESTIPLFLLVNWMFYITNGQARHYLLLIKGKGWHLSERLISTWVGEYPLRIRFFGPRHHKFGNCWLILGQYSDGEMKCAFPIYNCRTGQGQARKTVGQRGQPATDPDIDAREEGWQ